MQRRVKDPEVPDPSIISAIPDISVCEAKTFWENKRKEGKVDVVFKEVQSKLQLLCQKIKNGSATNQDYVRALLLVNQADLEGYDHSLASELLEDEDCPSVNTQELLPISTNSDEEKALPSSEPETSDQTLPIDRSVHYRKHSCGQMCISHVNPNFSKIENPLKFPIICQFQRRHAKSGLISRHLDVVYKAPCGKSLRDYDDVCSYLYKTQCRFLSLDHFSFDTYLQLDRNLVKNQVVVQEPDISRDAETVPVPFCNEIDNTRPASFTYRKSPWPRGYTINNFTDLFQGCCDCTDGCCDVSKCACLQLTTKELSKDITFTNKGITPGYKNKRLQAPVPTGIYECNISCKCDRKMCQNRVVQHGLQVRLQVFKTKGKGWGVRCLDDLDRGTFVCIYAGHILMKSIDANKSTQSMVTMHTKMLPSICPTKRRCSSHSDSEISTTPSVASIQKFRITPLLRGSSQTDQKRKSLCNFNEMKPDPVCIKRPKTKTAILQQRRRQLLEEGALPMVHSSDDELFTPPASPKMSHTGNDKYSEKSIKTTSKGISAMNDEAGYVSDESSSPVLCGIGENTDPPNPTLVEDIYFLDASTEGNVGRFLNHSCSPNLFVQHVFVETHLKKFPWLAFFTKSFIKAGSELTWEYNYDIGSIPEMEIPCLCGHKTCKKVIV